MLTLRAGSRIRCREIFLGYRHTWQQGERCCKLNKKWRDKNAFRGTRARNFSYRLKLFFRSRRKTRLPCRRVCESDLDLVSWQELTPSAAFNRYTPWSVLNVPELKPLVDTVLDDPEDRALVKDVLYEFDRVLPDLRRLPLGKRYLTM